MPPRGDCFFMGEGDITYISAAIYNVPTDDPCGSGLLDNLRGSYGHDGVGQWGADCEQNGGPFIHGPVTKAHFVVASSSFGEGGGVASAVNASTYQKVQVNCTSI